MTDWTTLPLSACRDRFKGTAKLAVGDHSALEFSSDKYKTVVMARQLQVPVPRTHLVQSISDLGAAGEFSFPAVMKDRFSARWTGNRAVFGSVMYAYSPDDLRKKVEQRLAAAGDVLVQEFVPGAGIGFSALAINETLYAPFEWLRVREVDPRGSGSSARKSVPFTPEIRDFSAALIRRIGFQGICMVEYKRAADGRTVLMEINGRPWGSIQLPIESGIDYPRYFVDWHLEGKLPPREIHYKKNILCRRVVSELTHLEHVFRGTPAGWPIPYPSLWTTALKMSAPWYPGMRYDDLWFTDPRPGLAGIANWFKGHLARAKRSW